MMNYNWRNRAPASIYISSKPSTTRNINQIATSPYSKAESPSSFYTDPVYNIILNSYLYDK